MSHAVYLTPEEHGITAAALRQAIRHADRGRSLLIEKFGEDANTTGTDARLALLESAYRKMGKDPSMIEGRS